MKRSALSMAISAILAVGLGGCLSQSDGVNANNAANPETEQNFDSPGTDAAKTASVNLRVKFPGSDDAQSAIIDANADKIDVRITRIPWGDWQAARQAMLDNDCGDWNYDHTYCYDWDRPWFDYLDRQDPAANLQLTPDSPSASVDLYPGQAYLIQAYQRTQGQYSNYNNDADFGGSSSIAILQDGQNNIVLNMLHGTWNVAAVNGDTSATSFQLQLLNQTDTLIDLEPDTEGVQPLDFDPKMEGTQSAADALGVSGHIQGLHLFGQQPFQTHFGPQRGLFEEYPDSEDRDDDDFNIANVVGSSYAGVWRTTDGTPGALEMLSITERRGGGDWDSGDEWWLGFNSGGVLQTFNNGQNMNEVSVGSWWAGREIYDPVTDNHSEFGAGLFSLARTRAFGGDMPNTDEDGFGTRTDDGSVYTYTSPGEVWHTWTNTYNRGVPTGDGSYEYRDFIVANVDQSGSDVTQVPIMTGETPLDEYPASQVNSGTSMDITLIEYVDVGSDSSEPMAGDPPPAPDNLDTDMAYYSSVSASGSRSGASMASISSSVMLQLLAQNEGLIASAAGGVTGSANCMTLDSSEERHHGEYLWLEETQEWVSGSWNHSYYFDTYYDWWDDSQQMWVADENVGVGEDLDGDGVAEPFEMAYFNESLEKVNDWDSSQSEGYGEVCMELPGTPYVEQCFIDTTLQAFEVVVDDSVDPPVTAMVFEPTTSGDYMLDRLESPLPGPDDDGDGNPDYYQGVNIAGSGLDLDGDGNIERYEAQYMFRSESWTAEVCFHEITLSGGQLTHIVTGDVVIK